MKATGVVRRIDNLGRVVLPIELRRTLDLDLNDPVEVFVDGDFVMLRKYQPSCIFCNESANLFYVNDRPICGECLEKLKNL